MKSSNSYFFYWFIYSQVGFLNFSFYSHTPVCFPLDFGSNESYFGIFFYFYWRAKERTTKFCSKNVKKSNKSFFRRKSVQNLGEIRIFFVKYWHGPDMLTIFSTNSGLPGSFRKRLKFKTFILIDESFGYKITWNKLNFAMEWELLLFWKKNLKNSKICNLSLSTKVFLIPSSTYQAWISELITIYCIQSSAIINWAIGKFPNFTFVYNKFE